MNTSWKYMVVSRGRVVVPHGLDVISVINDHILDRINVDGQGVLVVESDAYEQKTQISDNWFRCTE
jgi:hypothetical protein